MLGLLLLVSVQSRAQAPPSMESPARTMTRDQFLQMMSQAANGGAEAMRKKMEDQRRQMMEQSMGKQAAAQMFAQEAARRDALEKAVNKVVSTCLGVSDATMDRLSKKFEGDGMQLMASAQTACKQKLPETIQMGPGMEKVMEPFGRCVFETSYAADAKKEGITYDKMQHCSMQADPGRSLEERLSAAGSDAEKAALRSLAEAEQSL